MGNQKRHSAHDDIVIKRRERVASLRNRGLTQREIQATLATPKLVTGDDNPSFMLNPDTGQPFDLAQINRDLSYLRNHDKKSAVREIEEWRGRELAEIREVRRAAWGKGDLKLVLASIELEAKIRGTIITKVDMNGKFESTTAVFVVQPVAVDYRQAIGALAPPDEEELP